MKFHRRCGDRVTLLHDNTTAVRNFVEFNHGLILSAEPLADDVIFEVCIDRKVNVWNGSLEIGVTTQDPEFMDLPATATKLRNTAWIMSGCSVVKDGVTLINEYGPELDSLHEGEIVGVMKSSKGELSFYVNGRCLGVAAEKIPNRVFAVIDLYGQCVQVTIVSHHYRRLENTSFDSITEAEALRSIEPLIVDLPIPSTSNAPATNRQQLYIPLTAPTETGNSLEEGEGQQYNNDWQMKRDSRETNSESSGSGDPDQDVMSDRCTDEDSREDRYDSIARGIRDIHLDSNVTVRQNRDEASDPRCRVGMLYDWHLDQLTPYTGDTANSQFDNSLSEVSEAGLTSEESEAVVDEVRPVENRIVETIITMPDDDNDLEESEAVVDEVRPVENRIVETIITMPDDDNDLVAHDKLRFHPRCGFLVKISPSYRSAERSRPLDDYNNGVVMTHRPLRDNELFEIRIDKLVDKWSGSIEMGVTHHNPATIRYPSTMTNMDSGTIMMSGCKVLLNGHGTCLEYGNMNLDELREGDRVGVVRKSNGQLHYVINGADQGVAAERVQPPVWGVVDLYGMTVKVTIQDTSSNEMSADSNTIEPLPPVVASRVEEMETPPSRSRRRIDEDSLLFHTLRDSHVTIINDGKTAHRPNAFEYFHNGVVTTNRTLRTNELFQVRLDLVIPKWAGSIEIGVTQHPSSDLKFPFRISNTKTGTWVLAGEDVIQNSNVIIPKYVRNLSRLKEGDTVGVVRKEDGILHFYVNGVDQGPAACNVPEHVFGIVDLYGRVAQLTIVDTYRPPLQVPFSPESLGSSDSNATVYPEMCFHRVHGRNARLSRTRLTASRTAVYSEFNDAVLFSSRPLRECDMFELRIDGMVDCWIGSIEIGVTAIRPEDFEANGSIGSLAGTATDLNSDTYILSGAAMMKDGECVKSGYPLDLDTLSVGSRVGKATGHYHSTYILSGAAIMMDGECVKNGYALDLNTLKVGSRVGMMWHADRSLHYYLDGMDMGKAWYVPHLNIYAVVDLYGQCTQVTLLQNEERTFNYNGRSNSDSLISSSRAVETPPPPYWSFSEYCGDNVKLMQDYTFAKRLTADPNGALVFSSAHLAIDEIFEIKIVDCGESYAGNLRVGVTDVNILNAHVNRHMPPSVNLLPHFTAYIDGRYIRYSKPCTREQEIAVISPSFDWLRVGDRVGLKKSTDGRILIYLNGDLLETCFENVPDKVYVVIEIYGRTSKIQAVSKGANVVNAPQSTIPNDEHSGRFDILNEAGDLYIIKENDIYTEQLRAGQLKLAEPEASDPEEIEQDAMEHLVDEELESVTRTVPDDTIIQADQPQGIQTVFPQTENVRKRKYTFHTLCGRNVQLLSSDTVARRKRGYGNAIAVMSMPLKRGESCWFRVDKTDYSYKGSVSVGAIPYLPIDPLPHAALDLPSPAWILSSEYILNETIVPSTAGMELDRVREGNAIGVHFEQSGQITIEIDYKQGLQRSPNPWIPLALVKDYTEIYAIIDVYGKIEQISLLLYEHYFIHDPANVIRLKQYNKTIVDQDRLNSLVRRGKFYVTPASPYVYFKTSIYNRPCILSEASLLCVDSSISAIKKDNSTYSNHMSLSNLTTLKSFSSSVSTLRITYPFGCGQNDWEEDFIESAVIAALTLECKDIPDVTDDHSVAYDWKIFLLSPTMCSENLRYIKRILGPNQEGAENSSLEAEWESSDACPTLHLTLKYWKSLHGVYSQLRSAVAWGQIKCYCSKCEPSISSLKGWVRIERIDGVGAASKGFLNITKSMIREIQNITGDGSRIQRPTSITLIPPILGPPFELWMDNSKLYEIKIAVEIDIEGYDEDNDRLLAVLISLRDPAPSDDASET